MIKLPSAPSFIPMEAKDNITMIYGPPGVGKTTFVNGLATRVLFLSTDRGTRNIEAMRIECLTWEKFERVLEALQTDKQKYDIICFDHVDDWAAMAEDATCEEMKIESLSDAGYGKAWRAYRKRMEGMIRDIMRLGVGIVFIAHEDIKTVKTNVMETQRIMPAMSKSAWKVIIPLADIVGYAGFRMMKIEGKEDKREVRILQTQPSESVYAKDRTRRVKPPKGWEELNGKKFIATFTQGA